MRPLIRDKLENIVNLKELLLGVNITIQSINRLNRNHINSKTFYALIHY